MNGLDANPAPSSSPPPQRGFWRRLFLRGLLVGGIGLVLLLAFLIAITVPNLGCEVTPPEISGPEQAERNRTASSTAAPSGILTSDAASTSETSPFLNLDDYPHLSPTLRRLTQAWLDQLPATDKALETISDPVLRAQIRAFLLESRQIQAYLNIPLIWDDKAESEWPDWTFYGFPNSTMPTIKGYEDWNQLLGIYPEFEKAFHKESSSAFLIGERIPFEFLVHSENWDRAGAWCFRADLNSLPEIPPSRRWGQMNSWEEERYCLRQMGAPGWVCLTGRSYQRVLDSYWQVQPQNRFQRRWHHRFREIAVIPIDGTFFTVDYLQFKLKTD